MIFPMIPPFVFIIIFHIHQNFMLETPQMFQSILPNFADHIELSEPYITNYSLQKTTFYFTDINSRAYGQLLPLTEQTGELNSKMCVVLYQGQYEQNITNLNTPETRHRTTRSLAFR